MMRKLCFLMALVLSLAFCGEGFSATNTTILGVKNSSGSYPFVIDSDGVVTFASDTGVKFPYTSGTTNGTITATMTGTTYVLGSGATSPVTLELPAAVVGMEYTFIADSTQYIKLNPNSSEIINYASLSAGDSIYNSSAAKGDSITIFCVADGAWSIKAKSGTWASGG